MPYRPVIRFFGYAVRCHSCPAEGPPADTPEKAREYAASVGWTFRATVCGPGQWLCASCTAVRRANLRL
jgi:hypothetical protein